MAEFIKRESESLSEFGHRLLMANVNLDEYIAAMETNSITGCSMSVKGLSKASSTQLLTKCKEFANYADFTYCFCMGKVFVYFTDETATVMFKLTYGCA
jgi:hypothetical protein